MNLAITVLTITGACVGALQQADGARRFQLAVPPHVDSEQTHLLLQDVVVPRNQPVVLRVYAVGADGSKIYLGSTAVPAMSEDSGGVTSINVLRINVTSGLRTWRSAVKSARTVSIEISAPSGGSDTTTRPPWSVGKLQLVHPKS